MPDAKRDSHWRAVGLSAFGCTVTAEIVPSASVTDTPIDAGPPGEE